MIARAREILRQARRERREIDAKQLSPGRDSGAQLQQVSFTAIDEKVLEALREADLNELTPLEALNLLAALQKQLK